MNPVKNDPRILPRVLAEYILPILLPRFLRLPAYILLTSGNVAPISIVGKSIIRKDRVNRLLMKVHQPGLVKLTPMEYNLPNTGIESMADSAMPI